MSSFTKHTSISPTDNGIRITTEWFRYYIGEEGSFHFVDIPAWFEFDGASVPSILWMFIQRVEPDTIMSACLHDWLYIHKEKEDESNRIATDLIFLESLIVYNIPRLLKEKKYLQSLLYILKYIIMTAWLLLFSWFVWYKLEKKIRALFVWK
jgi:hypothetical protein